MDIRMGIDILSPEGFLQNLLQVCRLKPGGSFLAAPVCSTFVFMTLGKQPVFSIFANPKSQSQRFKILIDVFMKGSFISFF